jgi:single-strand DNA-binding protein
MSRSLNKVALLGHVGSDPEVRSTQNGGRVASFSLATSNQWTDASGNKQEKTEWHRLVVWNQGKMTLADVVERYVKKGAKLYVEGAIEYREWTDKDNQKRFTTEIKVRELILLGTSRAKGEDDGASAPAKSSGKSGGVQDDFSDFPGALKDEDDDLPFN